MPTEFDIQGPTRVCAATGRELGPGERFFAVLTDEGGKFVRRDFAADAWAGPPAGVVAYWAGRVPASDRPRKPTFNDGLLLDCFHHLAGTTEPDRVNFRFVVALLLMRRKRLKFEDARAESNNEVLRLRCVQTKALHEVVNPALGDEEMRAVQEEVFKVLGWQ